MTAYGDGMRNLGRVLDGHSYELPEGWSPAPDEVLETAHSKTMEALNAATGRSGLAASGRLERYFDPDRGYAGATFNGLDRGAGAANLVTASDLLAVTLLNVDVDVLQVRQLLEDTPKRAAVTSALAGVPRDMALWEFNSGTRDTAQGLVRLYALYSELRATPEPASNKWVFASKLCARKLPHLMPVRDTVVCEYLAGKPLSRQGGMSHFEVDLQVFAFLMSDPQVRAHLKELQSGLRQRYGVAVEAVPSLRVLDVALWMAGRDVGLGRTS